MPRALHVWLGNVVTHSCVWYECASHVAAITYVLVRGFTAAAHGLIETSLQLRARRPRLVVLIFDFEVTELARRTTHGQRFFVDSVAFICGHTEIAGV